MVGAAGIAILGGSFNPVHIGHLRLAIEALQNLQVSRVDLVPAFSPPHKQGLAMLPFALRVGMLKAAIKDIPGLTVNTLEGERPGLSYTWDTLGVYLEENPGVPLFFILSLQDLATLPLWHHGREIISRATLIVVPREGEDEAAFRAVVESIWGECAPQEPPPGCLAACEVNCQGQIGRIALLRWSRLNISSSELRLRLQKGEDIHFLVPDAALKMLKAN